MDLCNESCSSVLPSIWRGKHFNIGHYTQTFQSIFFHTCQAYRQNWLLPFETFSLTLTFAVGSQGQRNAKPTDLTFFLAHFHLIRMKFDVAMKRFKLNIPRLLLSKIF